MLPIETRILLLRHAETAAPQLFHGAESDIGLSERGVEQTKDVAEALAGVAIHAIYSSNMLRARLTADAIARRKGLVAGVIEPLHERKMGPLSGTLHSEGWHIYTEAAKRWMAGELDHTHEGGESYTQIRDRVVPAFLDLARRHQGETIVVVVHGVVIRVLLTSLLEGLDHRDFDAVTIENTAINDLRWDGARWYAAERGVRRLSGSDSPTSR
ncbi:histidine phosphatase family protein [Singulisphaera sp. PoT]|uniref:histidine phosphatase family protein n=1 Tax=Singulisphaera sp. PoT TaxID=3411797 RepID=UPI003BF5450A